MLLQCPHPACCATQVDAINRLRAGVVDKVFLEFEQPAGGVSAAAAAAGSDSNDGGSAAKNGGAAEGPGSGSAEAAVSHALLWSCPWEGKGSASMAAGDTAAAALLAVPAAAEGGADMPEWARDIFSLRFGGPEFKQRQAGSPHFGKDQQQQERGDGVEQQADSGLQAGQATDGGDGAAEEVGTAAHEGGEEAPEDAEFNPCAEAAQPTSYQAVAWLTGEAALAMESASDEEVLGALRQLGTIFPQLQLPPGASWDRVALRR